MKRRATPWRAASRVEIHESFGEAFSRLQKLQPDRPLFVVADSNLLRRHPGCLDGLAPAERARVHAVTGGERCKSLRRLESLYREARDRSLGRDTLVVAVGGGTIGDLVGFFAATWMRGLAWCTVATTSLAMADSALGGKTAVDWGGVKNPVGAFHPPVAVLGVREALETLPPRHLRAGMAEILKAAIIGDAALYRRLSVEAEALAGDPRHPRWRSVLQSAARVKGRIVRADPYEEGPRALLNFGHSFGHALEVAHRPRWLHGEAVGVGMLAAVELSQRKGLCEAGLRLELARTLHGMKLPVVVRALDEERFWAALTRDKKRSKGRLRLVLTEGPGSATFGHVASKTQLRAVLRSLRA